MSELPSLNRPAFFDRQQLTAADLTAVQGYHTELLWLHQRYLHDWGIVSGLAVTGAKGATSVTVAPGFAIDNQGRSIVLTAPVSLPVPAVVGAPAGGPMAYHVTLAYSDDDDLRPVVRAGTCDAAGAVLRLDVPQVRWQEPGVGFGHDVVLAAAAVLNCRLAAPVDLAPRRSALPERQPYLYAGRTSPAGTGWQLWQGESAVGAGQRTIGLQVDVDTGEAGFGNTPLYQAQVLGERLFVEGDASGVLDGHAHVEQPSSSGFRLRIPLPVLDGGGVNPSWLLEPGGLVERVTKQGWTVGWVGLES